MDEQTVAPGAATSAEAPDPGPPAPRERVSGLAAGILTGIGLVWLAATFATAHASVVGNAPNPDVALSAAAFALPNLIAAALVAGAGLGLSVSAARVGPLTLSETPVRRLLAGLAAGAVLGGACAALVVFGYGTYAQVTTLAVSIGVGALLGGAAASLPRPVLAAGVAASVAVLVVGLVAGFAQPGLVGLFGGGRSLDSQVSANWTVAYVVAAAGGIAGGLLTFRLLRGYGPRPWPWYLVAGAAPGLLLLVAELLTRTGGATLLNVVRGLSEVDGYTVDVTGFARLRNAMVVTFVGGFTAMIAVGRTMRPARDDSSDSGDSRDSDGTDATPGHDADPSVDPSADWSDKADVDRRG